MYEHGSSGGHGRILARYYNSRDVNYGMESSFYFKPDFADYNLWGKSSAGNYGG